MGRNILINKEIPLDEIRREKQEIKKEWAYFGTVLFHTDVGVLYRPFRFIQRMLLSEILFIAP